MPIITKPSPLEKNATGVFSLDKTALALHPIVVASSHFSSPNVWDKIIVKYKSETLGQFESIEFDASLASPEGQFFVSETAEDIFEIEKITIIDKDGAILLIPRAELTVAEFDIDFSESTSQLSWNNNSSGYLIESDNGVTTTAQRPSGATYDVVYGNSESFVTGDFVYEAEVSTSLQSESLVGFYDSAISSTYNTFVTGGTNLNFLITAQWGSLASSVAKPAGNTFLFKITRTGTTVKLFVNNTEVASKSNTVIEHLKVPFFTLRPNDYIVSATIS